MSDNVVPLRVDPSLPPDFITRVDINKMNDQQLDELIAAIRSRRLLSFYIYEQTQNDLEAVRVEKAKVQIEKTSEQIIKTLNTLDKQFEKLETQVHKLRGLRIQAGLNVI